MKDGERKSLTLSLGKGKTDLLAVNLVFFIDVFNKGLEVFSGFIRIFSFGGFSGHDDVLFNFYKDDYSIIQA
jgi:hypothetical protein